MKAPTKFLTLGAVLLLGTASLFAQSTGTTTGTTDRRDKANPHTPNERASDNAKAVQAVLQRFDASRDQLIAERNALVERLKAARTEAERKAILEEMRAEKQANKEQRTQLGKEIREEIKKLREQRKGGG